MTLSRRDLGRAAVASTLSVSAVDAEEAGGGSARTTFVLVHGAWHGGWCWRRVERLLRKAGHDVFTPTLTGLADRAHLLTRAVNLGTHVDDVVKLLEVEELREVVLVGHSYAGMILSAAGPRLASRLKRLVFLDALVPASGQSFFDTFSPKWAEAWRKRVRDEGEGWKLPPAFDAKSLGIADPKDAAWVDGKLTPHPAASMEEKAEFDVKLLGALPKTYLVCKAGAFASTAERQRKAGWEVLGVDAGHDAMVSAPQALAELLRTLA